MFLFRPIPIPQHVVSHSPPKYVTLANDNAVHIVARKPEDTAADRQWQSKHAMTS